MLMTIKTRDIVGPGNNAKDPLVIHEEEELVGGNTKIIKSWNEIQKGQSQ